MPRSEFRAGVVITSCLGREENLTRTLRHLAACDPGPEAVVLVFDGCDEPQTDEYRSLASRAVRVFPEKHAPGREQPRNVGARALRALYPDVSFVWFLDSDMIFEPGILARYREAHEAADRDRILIGPYFFMGAGQTSPGARQDSYRQVSFDEHPPDHVLVNDLGAGLACFGGNLVWPLDPFERVGGFHPDLHHGRCEDGELGLRASSAGVPMSFAREAMCWHVYHPVDHEAAVAKNARDVPMLNAMHPWVQERGLVVTHEDGARFDFVCPECGEQVNTLLYWPHMGEHGPSPRTVAP